MGMPMTPFTLLPMIGLPVSLHVLRSPYVAFGDRFPVSAKLQTLIDTGITSLWAVNTDGSRSVPTATLELLELLEFGDAPSASEQVLVRVQDAVAEEAALILDGRGVAGAAQDVDLCMIAGAGWPLQLGGITPYLDRVGASEKVNGRSFHPILGRGSLHQQGNQLTKLESAEPHPDVR